MRWPFGPPHLNLHLPKPKPPQKQTKKSKRSTKYTTYELQIHQNHKTHKTQPTTTYQKHPLRHKRWFFCFHPVSAEASVFCVFSVFFINKNLKRIILSSQIVLTKMPFFSPSDSNKRQKQKMPSSSWNPLTSRQFLENTLLGPLHTICDFRFKSTPTTR